MKIYIVYDREPYYEDIGSIHSVWSTKELAEKYIKKYGDANSLIDEFELDTGKDQLFSDLESYVIQFSVNKSDNIKFSLVGIYSDITDESVRMYNETKSCKYYTAYVHAQSKEFAKQRLIELYEKTKRNNSLT